VGALVLEAFPPRGIVRLVEKEKSEVGGWGGSWSWGGCLAGCPPLIQDPVCAHHAMPAGPFVPAFLHVLSIGPAGRPCLSQPVPAHLHPHPTAVPLPQGDRSPIERPVAEDYMLATCFDL